MRGLTCTPRFFFVFTLSLSGAGGIIGKPNTFSVAGGQSRQLLAMSEMVTLLDRLVVGLAFYAENCKLGYEMFSIQCVLVNNLYVHDNTII